MTAPGYYHAEGDPPGLVRYWDGAQWTGEPMPPPPGHAPAGPVGSDHFATVGIRIGASLLDGLVGMIVMLPFLLSYLGDVFDDVDAGGDGTGVELPSSILLVGIGLTVVWFLMVAYLGGTPGKLIVGLRITRADGTTTPPGLGPAALRSLPGLDGSIPAIGPLIAIGVVIGSIVLINTDAERRSVYDFIAKTRVVRKSRL